MRILEIQVGGDYQRFADYISLSRELNALDSDQDGLIDDDEINSYFTDPIPIAMMMNLSDGDEVLTYSTNPNQPDSDSDGLSGRRRSFNVWYKSKSVWILT